jgi:PEP-CTERM motif
MKSRQKAKLSESFNKRFTSYATAAGAAGIGLLALTPSAKADIIFTPASQTLTNGTLSISLNNDGINDFQFADFASGIRPALGTIQFFYRTLRVNGLGNTGNQVMLQGTYAAALARGAAIGPGGLFGGGSRVMGGEFLATGGFSSTTHGFHTASPFGPWANAGDRFLGLTFDVGGQEYFGWAELNVTTGLGSPGGLPSVTAVLTGYAYDTVPGQGLSAGQTTSTPEPSTLGLLALGSLGLGLWRRRAVGGKQ